MEPQPENDPFQKERGFLIPENTPYYLLSAAILLVWLWFLLFSTKSIELTCIREPMNLIECRLVKNTPLLRMSPIKIHRPLAVDVINIEGEGQTSYSAEIRAAEVSYRFSIFSSYNYGLVQDFADEVNDFLLRSNETSLLKIFPENKEKS